jgi:hypothetical protein
MAGPIWFVAQPTDYGLRGATRLGALWGDEKTSVKLTTPRGLASFIADVRVPCEAELRVSA